MLVPGIDLMAFFFDGGARVFLFTFFRVLLVFFKCVTIVFSLWSPCGPFSFLGLYGYCIYFFAPARRSEHGRKSIRKRR